MLIDERYHSSDNATRNSSVLVIDGGTINKMCSVVEDRLGAQSYEIAMRDGEWNC
jgi:hypothetical protein